MYEGRGVEPPIFVMFCCVLVDACITDLMCIHMC